MFDYRAVVVSVVDGDTIHVDLHLGFEIWQKNATIRLTGINAPELNATDPTIRASAVASRNALLSWLPTGTKVTMLSDEGESVLSSYYNYGEQIMYIGLAKENNLTDNMSLIVVFHETGHCMQDQLGYMRSLWEEKGTVGVELDADRWAAQLAC